MTMDTTAGYNVNARHLRFFKKDQIHEIIPKSELGILAEFEYLLNLWQISKGYTSLNTKLQLNLDNESNLLSLKDKPQEQSNIIIATKKSHTLSDNQPFVVAKQAIDIKPSSINIQGSQVSSPAMVANEPVKLLTILDSDENSKISNAKRMKFEDDDKEQFTLETIIPELLNELKSCYESKDFLSRKERSLLCSSIVDYFESRKIKFSSDAMDVLAEQIIEHFPTEDKKSWCNRNGSRTCGRFYFRLCYLREKMVKQTNNTYTSKAVTNSTPSEDEEEFTLDKIIPELLKEVKGSYESKGFLSANERSFLCSSIVDYFECRKIKFSSDTMDVLAEEIVKHFPTEDKKSWCNRDFAETRGRFIFRVRYSRRNMAKQTCTNSTPRKTEDDKEKFTLETIIPKLLKKLKESYESKDSLSTNERRLLCSSIVDYFESRKIKFISNIMNELAEQIVEHFPTEDKKSWCNRDGRSACGRFVNRLHYLREKMTKQTNNTYTSKAITNSTSSEDEEEFTLETILPELLKEVKDRYESNGFLSANERSLLCSSIMDYFRCREIKFSSATMDVLAEQIVENFPTEDKKSWCNRDFAETRGRFIFRVRYSRRNMAKQTSTNSTPRKYEYGKEKFTLETFIPELLKELKESYESKELLSRKERSLLCSSIVDYFESGKIKFSSDAMDVVSEQIVEHFPTEDSNRDGSSACGRFVNRLYYLREKIARQTNNTSTSKVVTNSSSSGDEDDEEKFTLETIVPGLLKKLKDSYESKDSLSTNERRLLCSSIVDYFESRKIKFSSNIMNELAEQISEHFPKEHKKAWFNRDGPDSRSRNIAKQTNNTSTSKVTLGTIIPELLRELKDSYESKNSLSINERHFLCSSIVDYFVSRKIKFSSDKMAELAEEIVEHFPTEDKKSWCSRDGPRTCGCFVNRLHNLRRNMAIQTNNTSASKVDTNSTLSEDEDDEEKFTLETIIPELLKKLKESYESKDSLSTNERRLLCSSIADYFENRRIKFSSNIMDELAEQIVEHFPTEDKKTWYNRDGRDLSGSFICQLYNSRSRNMVKQTNNTSTSKFTLETILPELLKNLKNSYESKNSLSVNERNFLCSSIVDYYVCRKITFSSDKMDELAEQVVEHFPTEEKKSWCNRDGPRTCGRFYFRFHNSRRNMAKQTNNTSTLRVDTNSASSEDENSKISIAKHMKFDDDGDKEQFTLETILPELLKNLKDSYESKNSLSIYERRYLCSSIVDYFESRKIKFSSDTMNVLAEQITEHFPTENKKSWCNRDGTYTRCRLIIRVRNLRRNMARQTNNTSTSKVGTNSTSSED